MFPVVKFRKSDFYQKLSDVQKEYAERLIREKTHQKSPREVNSNVLTDEDIAIIKGKLA
jgi:hypothetical protein